ncbi:MAG: adenosylcobinamide-GDP ribazoletransferase [Bacilli bacterium]
MKSFLYALSFLTIIPIKFKKWDNEKWFEASKWYSFVGLLMGVLLYFPLFQVATHSNIFMASSLYVVMCIVLSGGLHLDGWMDVSDALGSRRDRETMLSIMKDSRVGAFGVIAFVCLFVIKWATVYTLLEREAFVAIVSSVVFGRICLTYCIRFGTYIRPNGMGSQLSEALRIIPMIGTTMLLIFIVFLLQGSLLASVLFASMALILVYLFYALCKSKFGGMTGDVYGAIVEWSEIVWLFLTVMFTAFGVK